MELLAYNCRSLWICFEISFMILLLCDWKHLTLAISPGVRGSNG
jgi:hypothetical protein